ncbi:MAG: PAS domain S-box protein, partial [Vicinamibacterales bacterium]
MTTTADSGRATSAPRLAVVLFGSALGLALLMLVLWAADRWPFATLGQGDVPMAPSTAVLMSLLALAGLRPASGRQARLTGVLLIVAGAFALSSNISALESAFVRLLTVGPVTRDAVPIGVMSPITASAFVLSGIGLSTRHARNRALAQAGPVCATLVVVLTSSIVAGHILDVPLLYGARVPMTSATGLTFLGCAFGLILTSRADTWPMSSVSDRAAATDLAAAPRGLALLFLMVAAAVAVGTTLYLSNSSREVRREATERLTAASALKQEEVTRWFKERLGDARIVRSSSFGPGEVAAFLAERPGEGDDRAIRAWMSVLSEVYSYTAVVLYDRAGSVRLTIGGPAAPVSRTALDQAFATGEVVFDDLDKDDASGARQMSFLAPIGQRVRVPMGATGVMALIVDARTDFYPIVDRWPFSLSTGDFVLVRQDGADVVYLLDRQQRDPGARTLLRLPIDTPGLAMARVLGGQGARTFDGIDYRGQRVVAVGAPVAGTRWTLLAKQDADEIDAPFWSDVRRASAVSLLLLLTTGFGLTVVSRRQTLRSMSAMLAVQREREQSDARLRSAMNAALDAFIILDERGRIVEWNRQAEVTFGWSR